MDKVEMMIRVLFLTLLVTVSAVQVEESYSIKLPMWDYTRQPLISPAPHHSDEVIKVSLQAFADNIPQVPLQHIFTYSFHPDVMPNVSLRLRLINQGCCAVLVI